MRKAVRIIVSLVVLVSTFITAGISVSHAATPTFKDIGASHPLHDEIMYLAQGGIAAGDAKGYFKPKDNVTRGDFAAFLGRAMDLDGTKRKTTFKDVGTGMNASGYIQSAVQAKIISGYSDGTFKPNQKVTRGEMAVMVARAFGYDFQNSSSGAAQAMISRGIDTNQSDGTFAYNRAATREETAMFVARAIDYTLRLKPESAFIGTKYINTNGLNMRKGPLTSYEIVGSLNKGNTVSVAYTVGMWSMVKTTGGKTGFVSSKYLSNTSNTPTTGSADKSASSLKIVIDAGHGIQPGKRNDVGAVGNGLKESDITLDITQRLKKLFDQTPINDFYTRPVESYPTLDERAEYAKEKDADIFVSVHVNSFGNESGEGSETWYPSESPSSSSANRIAESKELASLIQKRFVKEWNTKDRGTKSNKYVVLVKTTMPAVLVETGFISNKEDAAKLGSPAYRQKAAQAIFYGILDYFKAQGYEVNEYYNIKE
ncbi:N-acetylmuramoyl-L-alanine amidase [Bacillus testis]|uniref:N-acetylmuramoyl-L-alanine amidase n=1 Tax=Bacillus testis TaxID=1622072 RepID=UPI00067F3494|nr:N-acetylmuramoyl-L-alanine amidase [Bacillus testis]